MAWNKEAAISHLDLSARSTSKGRCAEYTRRAIEAGGLMLALTGDAKNYGKSLLAAGFSEIPKDFAPEAGDVVVISSFAGHPHGHMAMFDGTQWVSDFKQRDLYPGPSYRASRPPYRLYRYR